MKATVYRALVPDAPKYKRTESDRASLSEILKSRLSTRSAIRVQQVRPGLKKPSLISTYAGSIKTILFSFPSYGVQDSRYYNAYRSLISALRHGTLFVVACRSNDQPIIEKWFTNSGHDASSIRWAYMPSFVNFTDWAEDAYVGLLDTEDGQHYLMEPWEFQRAGDALIADSVEEHTNEIRASQSPLMFQGGNCIIADSHWFLGRDYFLDSIELIRRRRAPVSIPSGMPEEEFVRSLFREYLDSQRQLVLLGSQRPIVLSDIMGSADNGKFFLDLPTGGIGSYQPIFHIDMLLTLIGDLGDGVEVMVGDPDIADKLLGVKSPFALPDNYNIIANQLSDLGFKVHRNPLVHWPTERQSLPLKQLEDIGSGNKDQVLMDACSELRRSGATDSAMITIREWHHITWNNCIVENSVEYGKHIYLPQFGFNEKIKLSKLDQHMANLWESLGFTVHLLGDFNAFAERLGVVHCIKKYLNRTEPPVTQ